MVSKLNTNPMKEFLFRIISFISKDAETREFYQNFGVTCQHEWKGCIWKRLFRKSVSFDLLFNFFFKKINCFVARIWFLQLFIDWSKWFYPVWSGYGGASNFVYNTNFIMWFEFNFGRKRHFGWCFTVWSHLCITFVGLSSRRKRSTCSHSTYIIRIIYFVSVFLVRTKLSTLHYTAVFQWIFVSWTLHFFIHKMMK